MTTPTEAPPFDIDISQVRIRLMDEVRGTNGRLKAFCRLTIGGGLVIRDLKVVQNPSGRLEVAMPSRKLSDRCPDCNRKNPLMNRYCGACGFHLGEPRVEFDYSGRPMHFADVCHPVTTPARHAIEQSVLHAYVEESIASRQPGYRSSFDIRDGDFVGRTESL